MDHTDKRNRLDEAPFRYRVNKDHTVFIDYYGKQVKILNGRNAVQFLNKMKAAENEKASQLVMAKVTGNFKRGNERVGDEK
ncbi:hypothetical protein [Paenibacillus harenae]|uniref:hypothetical protein n=1 Tax=Paenibacillus harenae TaxID=306543 RepID=UPI00041BF1DF|nr:hypothetical protein [Paenibacillus harenae]